MHHRANISSNSDWVGTHSKTTLNDSMGPRCVYTVEGGGMLSVHSMVAFNDRAGSDVHLVGPP